MFDSSALNLLLNRLCACRCGGSVVGRCALCQPEEEDPNLFKLAVSPGSSLPVLLFCRRCSVPKPQTEEDRRINRDVAIANVVEAGFSGDILFRKLPSEQIRQMWAETKIGVGQEPEGVRADDDTLHRAYGELLNDLNLSKKHKQWLAKKGLDPEWAEGSGYRTVVYETNLHLDDYDGVPGLDNGRWLLRQGALLIPCRDRYGRIGAIKQRLFGTGKSGRLRLLSGGGAKAKQMLHWPVGAAGEQGLLWATEGERKADVLHYHYRQPTVGVPGVGSCGQVAAVAAEFGGCVLAFDNDDAGRRATATVGRQLRRQGLTATVAVWEGHKGIDDALANGAVVKTAEWEDEGEGGEELLIAHPPQKGLTFGQILSDQQVIPYVRQFGPVLRSSTHAYPPTIHRLIREGQLVMRKDHQGQWLEVADAS